MLLTLLDNLGFTDNYMECMVPTVGVYPIATANDKSQISAPLMSRFAVIDIPDYTDEEKKVIFQRFALRKVFERMGMKEEECVLTEDGLDAVIINSFTLLPQLKSIAIVSSPFFLIITIVSSSSFVIGRQQ